MVWFDLSGIRFGTLVFWMIIFIRETRSNKISDSTALIYSDRNLNVVFRPLLRLIIACTEKLFSFSFRKSTSTRERASHVDFIFKPALDDLARLNHLPQPNRLRLRTQQRQAFYLIYNLTFVPLLSIYVMKDANSTFIA